MASDWREKYQKAIKDGSAAKRYQESSKDRIVGGKTGQEANKPVKGKNITKPPKVQHRDVEIAALGAGDYGASNSTRFDKTMNAAIYSTAAALENLHGTLKEKDARQRARDEADSKRLKAGYDAMIQGEDIYSRPGGLKKISEDADKDFEARYEKVRGAGDEYFRKADEMKKRSEQQKKEAKEGLGGFGQFAVDLGIAGAQFAGDIALNAALPGAGLAAMGMRAAGSAAHEARQGGRDIDTQLNTGLKSAAIEVLTEKLFGLGSKAAYGSGLIKNEKLINGIVNNLAKTNAGRTTLKLITGAAEEGAEEVLSDILNPVADRILKLDDGKGDWSDIGKDMDTQQMLADFLIGGTLGLFGAGTNVVNGRFKAENVQQRGYEKYQRELVNMGLEAEPGSRAQKAAETYKPIVEKSGKHFHRNLSDAETENLARLMDAPFAKKALADANILIDDNTADIIARAANGQRISQSERERLQKIPNIGEVMNEVALAGVKARALERTFTQELQPDGITLPRGDELLRDKTIESAERLSKITGREIRLYDADPSENGYYDRATGELYINRNSKNPLAQVVGHELTHSIEDAGAYTDLKSVIFSQIQKQGGDLAKMRQEKAALYEKHGHTLGSEEEIDAEIVAEFVEKNLLTDEASIKAVVTQSPSLGQRILQFINDLLSKIGDRKAQERAFLTKARGYYQTALRETENRPVNVTFKAEAPTQAAPSAKTTQATQQAAPAQEATQAAATQEAPAQQTTQETAQETRPKNNASEMTPDEYLESLRDQLARGEISEDEFSDLFDEYYNGGTDRQYSFAGQKASTANLEQLKNAQEMPDGSVFKFSGEKIDTTPERSQGVAQTRSLAETADAVSDNSIPTNTQSVNKQFSVSERTPEQKKEILAQARRYASGEIGKDEFFRHMDRIDGVRRSAPSRNAYRQPPKNQSYSDEAREIYDRAHSEGVSVDEYLRRNWEEFDIDGRWSDAAQEALRMDGRRYSVEEETASEEEPKEPRVRDTIPKKAERYLKRAEGALVKDLSDKLNVPKFAQKEYLNEIAQEISEEYLKTGTVSEETKNELFETAWENGRHIDDEFYNTYKDIKDYLKTQSVTLSETDKADITDWNQFKNSAFGSLRIVNKGGLPVDTAYQELQGMAPELFPPDITHPADQIQRMLEVSKSISVSEKSLDDHFGRNAEEYKKWARADFETAITDSLSALRTVKRYVEDGKAPADKLHTIDEVQNAYKGLKEARKKYEIANAKNLLTDHDKIQVGRLLRGEIELKHLDSTQDNVKGISAVFEAQEEYERISRTIREWNAQRKQELRDEADEYLQTANDWEDKKSGILYARETQERNVLDIVPDEKIAKAINRKYFMPVHQAEAKSAQFKKTMRGRVAALKLSTKETKAMKKAGKVSEAHAVQLIGEARDNAEMARRSRDKTRDGKTEAEWRAIEAELWKNNPDLDKAKIENAIKEFREIYDELLNMMNDVRIENGYEPVNYRRGYFPHFKKDSADNIIGLFGRALGIKTDVTELPTTINGMTHMFRPGIQWFGNALERTGFETTYDAVEGFDRYIEGVANVIYQTENIQRLRALASQARYRTGPEGLRKQIDAVRADTGKTEAEKTAIIDDLNANGKYELSNWVVNLDEYTNILAGKKSMADRNLEQALGRDMYNVVKAVESRVAANMVAINVGSWLTNFIPITQGYALLGTKDLLTGMKQTLAAMKESDGMVEASAFLTNRIGSDPLVQTWAQKASAKLSSPMSWIDNFTAGTLVRGRYNQNIRQGMSEAAAMEDADTFAANVMADRSKGSTPTLFNQSNPVTKLFTQFQLEVNNQLSYLFKDIPRETKDKGVKALALALLKFFLGAYLFDEAYEYFIGRRPALDPIGILVDTAQDIANGESAYDVITGTLEDTAEQLPFIGGILGGGRIPISSALPDAGNLLRAATNEDWDSKKRWSTIGKELAKPATYTLLPFGGGQIKKAVEGIDATIRGGSYTYDADGNDILQYPVYNQSFGDSAKSIAESVLFGKTALPTGREWIGSGFKSFGAKETAAYKELTESGTSQKDVYDTLKAIRAEKTNNGKRTAISDSSLTDNEKRILYNHIFGEKQENGTYKSTRTEEIAAFKEAGLDMDDFLKAQNQYTDIGKEYDTTSDKALAFSRWVNQQGWTADQKAAVNDSFKYYSQIPATAANYNSFADAGLGDETAYKLAKAINDLEPQDGADTVSSTQKWRAVVDTVKNTNDQLAALAQVMSESEYRKVSAGRAHGVEPSSYVAFKESLPKFDADGNGSFKQAEIKAAIDAMGEKYGTVLPGGSKLTIAQQAVLWQLANKSWKPKNNPYSVAIGQKVYNELNAK